MAQSFKLKRFANVAVLKQVDQGLLMEFLNPFREFLVEQRRMTWPDDPENLDHEALADILMSPGTDTPGDLLDALYFMDALSDDDCYDRILAECQEAGIDLGQALLSPEDLTLRVWLVDRNILEKVHAEQNRVRPKRFKSFFAGCANRPDLHYPPQELLSALDSDLSEWFDYKKKGRGARVFPFFREDWVWFLVRHGQRIKREGTMEADGASGSVFYRPERFDVLIYYPDTGELDIYADTKGEERTYCRLFGKHLFGDEAFFLFDDPLAKYTLRPLIDRGRAALVCGDIEGIDRIRLTELQILHIGEQKDLEIRRADDVFEALEAVGRNLADETTATRLIKAKFKVQFSGDRERTVMLEPPNIAVFDREADNDVIHAWLGKRGFIAEVQRASVDVA